MEHKSVQQQLNQEILCQHLELLAERSQSILMKNRITLTISNLDDLQNVLEKIANIRQALITKHGSNCVFEININLI